uniref:Uncharacterized protein n=1 Tax=Schistosoma japonicum TaxID=6182 RepID=Q5C6X2_SCHJA|nr:unknown [Schistosoma japonicum]
MEKVHCNVYILMFFVHLHLFVNLLNSMRGLYFLSVLVFLFVFINFYRKVIHIYWLFELMLMFPLTKYMTDLLFFFNECFLIFINFKLFQESTFMIS